MVNVFQGTIWDITSGIALFFTGDENPGYVFQGEKKLTWYVEENGTFSSSAGSFISRLGGLFVQRAPTGFQIRDQHLSSSLKAALHHLFVAMVLQKGIDHPHEYFLVF